MSETESIKLQFKKQMFKRLNLKLPVPVVSDNKEDGTLIGYVKNISAGGVFIKTSNPFETGTHVKMRFAIPGTELAVSCEGEVVWNRYRDPYSPYESGMGIRFMNLDNKLRAAIDNFVREQLR